MTNTFSIRVACYEEFRGVRSLSEDRDIFSLILKQQFRTFDAFLAKISDPAMESSFFLCTDDDGDIAGWACCFRFHERSGYAGVVQFVMDVLCSDDAKRLGSDLYLLCNEECRKRGMHTIVSFAHSNMSDYIRWHEGNRFDACGNIMLGEAEQLHVFRKRIAQ